MSERGVPTGAELAAALGEALREDVLPATSGREQFVVRVAAHVAGQLERELSLGPAADVAHAERLASLGAGSDAELVAAIRAGAFDGERFAELVGLLHASAVERLRIVNPRHLAADDQNLS